MRWADLDHVVGPRPDLRTAIFTDRRSDALPAAVSHRWRSKEPVVQLAVESGPPADAPGTVRVRADTPTAIHTALTAYGPFDVLVDATAAGGEEQVARLRRHFFHLREGGRYLTRRPGSGPDAVADFATGVAGIAPTGPTRKLPPLGEANFFARAFTQVRSDRGWLEITNGVAAMPKLRYDEIEEVLDLRWQPPQGATLRSRPPLTWDSRCRLRANRPRDRWAFPRTFDVPRLALRAYEDVLAAPHQVLVKDDILLPDSYRHSQEPVLNNHWTTDINAGFAIFKRRPRKPARLDGAYFYLGSEYPHHFGHVMTEQLSRLWAWDEAKQRFPDLKALVSVRGEREGLEPFEKDVFTAAGIAEPDLVAVKGPVRVETLLAANPMLVNNGYVHPDVAQVWQRTGAALLASAPGRDYPEKIFVGRRAWREGRRCHNSAQVEDIFRAHGFAVVYPEDYPVSEQAAIFDRARVIAGYAGSGLLSLLFCRDAKDVILVSSAAYNSHNEYLIASVLGHRLTMVWCDPDVDHPPGTWWRRAFGSPYTFDVDRDGKFLEEALASAG